jgi:hypothetical protein
VKYWEILNRGMERMSQQWKIRYHDNEAMTQFLFETPKRRHVSEGNVKVDNKVVMWYL